MNSFTSFLPVWIFDVFFKKLHFSSWIKNFSFPVSTFCFLFTSLNLWLETAGFCWQTNYVNKNKSIKILLLHFKYSRIRSCKLILQIIREISSKIQKNPAKSIQRFKVHKLSTWVWNWSLLNTTTTIPPTPTMRRKSRGRSWSCPPHWRACSRTRRIKSSMTLRSIRAGKEVLRMWEAIGPPSSSSSSTTWTLTHCKSG